MLTDYQGNKVTQVYYKPYGETAELSGEDIFHYKYTGQEEDNTTGLYYYSARFFDPAIGRFISPDTMIPDPTGTQDFNRYMYVKGDPVKYNDPTGHVGIINTPVNPPATGGGNESEGDNDATPYYNSSSYYPWNYTQQRQTPVKQTASTTFENMAKKFVSGSYDLQAGISPFAAVNLDFGWDYLSAIKYYWDQDRIEMSVGCLLSGIIEMGYDTVAFEFLFAKLLTIAKIRNIQITVSRAANIERANFTESTLELGQKIHKAYKAGLHNPAKGLFKEYRGIKGIRPDFVDFNTRTIYELKPNNLRSIIEGSTQLNKYKTLFEQEYGGIWNIILDLY